MLQAIQHLDPDAAQSILSKATGRLLPDPGHHERASLTESDEAIAQRIITEIKNKLNLNQDDNSYETRCDILGRLAKEISSYVITSKNESAIKDRLGDKGLLSPSRYQYEFNDDIEIHRAMLINREQVFNALKKPDAVEHLSNRNIDSNTNFNFSYYAKLIKEEDNKNNHFLVICAFRTNTIIRVDHVWRIYLSDIQMPKVVTPLSLMESFANKYGSPFSIGGSPLMRFARDKVLYPNKLGEETKMMEGPRFNNHSIIPTMHYQYNKLLDLIEVSLAYSIDTTYYFRDLNTHGIKAKHPD